VSNLPTLPGGLPSNLPSLPGGLPSSLPSSLPSLPSASSLASGGVGSGGNLPSSIPGSSLIPNPIPGNYRSQVAQGQKLFQAAQDAASGDPGSVATLLTGAATTVGNLISNGLPKTIIMDVAGIAAGYAVGGPVGAAVAAVSSAVSLITSIFSQQPSVWKGFEALPSDASSRNWSLIQQYLTSLSGLPQSGYPPGWYLAYYQAATLNNYTMADLTDLFLIRNSCFQQEGGDSGALAYLAELTGGTISGLSIEVGYTANSRNDPRNMLKDVPWKTPHGWGARPLGPTTTPVAGGSIHMWTLPTTADNYPGPKDSQFQAMLKAHQGNSPFDARWLFDGLPTIPIAFLWGDPSGQGLPGELVNGFTGASAATPGPTLAQFQEAYNPYLNVSNNPYLATFYSNNGGEFYLQSKDLHYSLPFAPVNPPSILTEALTDISDLPGMPRKTIASRALKLMPRNIWFDPSLYQMYATDNSGNTFTALYNLDVLNAMATIWIMSAIGAHPRAIMTELLIQQANVYMHGGPAPGPQNLSKAYQRFMDEWINISQGYPPDNHLAVQGQLSSDAPPIAQANHAQNNQTLAQWVDHYLR
jgi:hypothetical protein